MEEINNTPMNTSESNKWLSDLEIDEYNLFPEESNLNFLDADEDEFVSHDIASVFEEQTKQQCLTSECTSTTLSNSFTDETCFESFDFDFDFERQTKQLKTIDNDNNIIETFSTKVSSSSSNSSFQSQILCFDPSINTQQNEVVSVSQPQLGTKGSSKNQNLESQNKRSRANSHDHIMAERLRREKLSVSFIALGALIPGLKKMDKATVLADAIKYVKELKERLEVLEEQRNKRKADSVEKQTKADLCSDDEYSSSDESIEGAAESQFQVDVKVSGKEILIRIHCKKQKGLLVKIISEIQRFQLFVVKNSLLPFGESILDITVIAQMGEGYSLTTKELVKNLREAALKFMSLS